MERKFFVTVFAANRRALLNLGDYQMDLFQATARASDQQEFSIEGLLSTTEIERLVTAGYRVLIEEAASKRARATQEIAGFQEWMHTMVEEAPDAGAPLDMGATPPTGYLTAAGIESTLQHLTETYPAICQLIQLPEQTWEHRTSRAIKLGKQQGLRHPAILLLGGVHARELVNPDLLVSFALKLCQACTTGKGLTFGRKAYDAPTIQKIISNLDLLIFPLVNPDGRAFVQSPTGNPMWRKNRNPNPGERCQGVDLNRNFDFLWSSGIGTSSDVCSEIFKGKQAFSEPETRNVRYLLETYKNITTMLDIHSYSELILYPWGDDEIQTTTPTMNFHNTVYNGLRGRVGDTIYKEYMPKADLDWFTSTCKRAKDAIKAVRGRTYKAQPSIGLYPTTATSDDYVYSCHFLNSGARKILAGTLETGREFQPPYSEALNIIAEVSAGLIEFCLAAITAVDVQPAVPLERV